MLDATRPSVRSDLDRDRAVVAVKEGGREDSCEMGSMGQYGTCGGEVQIEFAAGRGDKFC